jgi:hypothetical protein
MRERKRLTILALTLLLSGTGSARQPGSGAIPPGAKLFIAPMEDGFDTYLKAALEKKKVPVTVVGEKSEARFEVTGHSETQKPGAAKKLILGHWHTDEQASIQIADLQSGEVVFAYSVNKGQSAHGKQSTAEACAKHLREQIEGKK